MDVKYNILWIDDQLAGNMKDTYEAAKDDFKELNIVGVVDMNAFKDQFYDKVWDAIIFDINNRKDINDENEDNEGSNILATLLIKDDRLEYIKENRIPIFAFSGELGPNGKNDVEEVNSQLKGYGFQAHPRTGAYFWDKSPKGELQDAIFQDIINFLNQKNQNYVGYEYLLEFFGDNKIDYKNKSEFLDPLMKIFHDKDFNSAHGNLMRNMTECMLEKINSILNITSKKPKDQSRWKDMVKMLVKSSSSDMHLSSVCTSMLNGPLNHMIDMANDRSHQSLNVEMRESFFYSDFTTFFLVTKWYDNLMAQLDIEGSSLEVSPDSVNTQTSPKQKYEPDKSGIFLHPYKHNGKTYVDIRAEVKGPGTCITDLYVTGAGVNNNDFYAYYDGDVNKQEEVPYTSTGNRPFEDLLSKLK